MEVHGSIPVPRGGLRLLTEEVAQTEQERTRGHLRTQWVLRQLLFVTGGQHGQDTLFSSIGSRRDHC